MSAPETAFDVAARINEAVNRGREAFLAENPFVPDIIDRYADLLVKGPGFPLAVNDPGFRPILQTCMERAIMEAVAARNIEAIIMGRIVAEVVADVVPKMVNELVLQIRQKEHRDGEEKEADQDRGA